MKNIELPRRVVTGDGAIEEIAEVADELRLWGDSMVISDQTTKEIAGDRVKEALKSRMYIVEGPADEEVEKSLQR